MQMSVNSKLKKVLMGLAPWREGYQQSMLSGDLLAGVLISLILLPQALAYATLAGVPAQYGLYSCLLAPLFYALFASSTSVSIGPAAVSSLLSAAALAPLDLTTAQYLSSVGLISLLSGGMLWLAGSLKLGAFVRWLSHPVMVGFVTAATILIIVTQIKALLGLPITERSLIGILTQTYQFSNQMMGIDALMGVGSLLVIFGFGFASRQKPLKFLAPMGKLLPVVLLGAGAALAYTGQINGAAIIGTIPRGLPELSLALPELSTLSSMILPTLLISLLGFISTFSVAQSYAQATDAALTPNSELKALGAANIGSAILQGVPVMASFSRTQVNVDSGASSPLSGVFSALCILLILLVASSALEYIPLAVLSAIIIASVIKLVKFTPFIEALRYDRGDALSMLATFFGVLFIDIESGVLAGVLLSVGNLLWHSSRPHCAVLGLIEGTEHFRNNQRFDVLTQDSVLMIRIDENLFFGNCDAVRGYIDSALEVRTHTHDLLLVMSSVSRIDLTGIHMLTKLSQDLQARDIRLHLAEVKGPVNDRLKASNLIEHLSGDVFLSAYAGFTALNHSHKPGKPLDQEDSFRLS